MKLLTSKLTASRLTTLANSTTAANMQELFVNLVHHALIKGNGSLESMLKIRTSEVPSKFKAALGKYMPIKFDKENGKYTFDSDKAQEMRVEFDLVYDVGTFEETAAVLPDLFAANKDPKPEFDLAKYLANVQKKLTKEEVCADENAVAYFKMMLENPEMMKAVKVAIGKLI